MQAERAIFLMDPSRLEAVTATGLLLEDGCGDLDRNLDLAARCLQAPSAAFLLLSERSFRHCAVVGLPAPLDGLSAWPLDWSYLLDAAFQGPLRVTDLREDAPAKGAEAFIASNLHGFLGTAVKDAAGNVLGLLAFWDGPPRAWADRDVALAGEFAANIRAMLADRQEARRARKAELDNDHRWVEEALSRSRNELEVILKTMDGACTAQDSRGNLVYANDAAARILDFPSAEMLMKTDSGVIMDRFDVLDEKRKPFPLSQFPGRIALQGRAVNGTVMCYRVKSTGEERWSLVNATPVFDAEGRVRMAINIFNDISRIKRAEDAAQKHVRYLEAVNKVSASIERTLEVERLIPSVLGKVREVFDASRAWLVHIGDDETPFFRLPFRSERADLSEGVEVPAGVPVEMLGADSGLEGIAASIQDSQEPGIYGAGGLPVPANAFWNETLGGGSMLALPVHPQVGKPWILCLMRPTGSPAWTDDDLALSKDIGSRLASVLGSMLLYRDMRRSEEKYRTLFERSLDGIYRCAVDGTLLDANPSLVAMLGYASRDDLVGMLHPKLLPTGGDLMGVGTVSVPAKAGDRGETFTVELERKDGKTVWVEVNTQPIRRQGGEIVYYEGIIRNIHDRKRAEEALKASEERLRQSQKMEAVGRLAGGVAHDFNNLLTAINGFSDLLLMSFPKEEPRRVHMEEIRKAGARAAALTSQLLSFSRKQVLAPRQLDLNEVITGMETMLRRLIGENIEFRTRLEPNLAKVVADPNQMEQVILNLVLNARDAMAEGGELLVTTANQRLDEKQALGPLEVPAGDYAVIVVRDTGMGMDEETKSRLFEPFFTTKPKDKGTGLGLSTVYGAVRQANGAISVKSELDHGSEFTIYLPHSTGVPRPERRPRPKAPSAPRGTETVLLVEDEDAVRRLVRDVLLVGGYKVLEAESGEKAMEVAARESGSIHLLLTDVVMGGMNGRELAERLRPERAGLKVLFMSGYTEDAILRHGVLTAHTAFIPKPFSPAAIASKVREVLDAVQEKTEKASA